MIGYIFIFLISTLFNTGLSEVFSSIEDLKEVLEIENVLAGTLNNYIAAERHKIDLLERYIEHQQRQLQFAVADIESYVGNPINAFLLIKRLTIDWKNLESLIIADTTQEFLQNTSRYMQDPKFPTTEDLRGAATGILRIQLTYQIDETLLIKGIIANRHYNSTLSASDCYELGKEAYVSERYFRALRWLRQVEAKLKQEPDIFINRRDLLERLSLAAYQFGYTELALNYTKELIEEFPEDKAASDYFSLFMKTLEDEEETTEHKVAMTWQEIYADLLCRKEAKTPVEVTSKLRCSYVDNNNPALRIAPFKVEELYLNPRIVIFHDMMSDMEIKVIKSLSLLNVMERTKVLNGVEQVVSKVRVSKVVWLKEFHSVHIKRLNRRIAGMTGLNTTSTAAEDLQVVNYGIGGHYGYHEDYFNEDMIKGNHAQRIATVLIYMSDVEEGGATVFPHLNVTIWPKKGSAAVWYNLDPYGNKIPITGHYACPVLVGSKWAANKWIKQTGQEFIKPCPLHKSTDSLYQTISASKN